MHGVEANSTLGSLLYSDKGEASTAARVHKLPANNSAASGQEQESDLTEALSGDGNPDKPNGQGEAVQQAVDEAEALDASLVERPTHGSREHHHTLGSRKELPYDSSGRRQTLRRQRPTLRSLLPV